MSTANPSRPDWYTTSREGGVEMLQYFDGATWSAPCYAEDPEHIKERARNAPAAPDDVIEWEPA